MSYVIQKYHKKKQFVISVFYDSSTLGNWENGKNSIPGPEYTKIISKFK